MPLYADPSSAITIDVHLIGICTLLEHQGDAGELASLLHNKETVLLHPVLKINRITGLNIGQ